MIIGIIFSWERIFCTVLLFVFFYSGPAFSGEAEDPFESSGWNFSFKGHYKNMFMYRRNSDYYGTGSEASTDKNMFLDLNRLRLSPEVTYGSSFVFHMDYDSEAVWSNYTDSREFESEWQAGDYNRIWKSGVDRTDPPMYYSSGFHRAYGKFSAGAFTFTAGRQQVRFGSSRLWNPLDLLNPVSPTSVEGAEDQEGIDAFRADLFMENLLEVSAVYNPLRENDEIRDTDMKSSNYAVRIKFLSESADAALLAGYVSKRRVAGADFVFVLFGGQLTAVALYSKPDESEKGFWQAGTGYEYTFSKGLYLLSEFFYNEVCINEDKDLRDAVSSFMSDGYNGSSFYTLSNRILTYNRYYLSLNAGYDIISILRADIFLIYDFEGRGLFASASFKYSVSDNAEVSLGVMGAKTGSRERVSDFETYESAPMVYSFVKLYF